jgi:fluoride exporter
MHFLWVGIGGFLGANARYALGRFVGHHLGITFPWGTGIVNISGAFLIGVIFTLMTDRVVDDPMWRQLFIIGLLGGYTTFSTFTFESVTMMQDGRWLPAIGYVVGSNVIGLLACFGGIWLVRAAGL